MVTARQHNLPLPTSPAYGGGVIPLPACGKSISRPLAAALLAIVVFQTDTALADLHATWFAPRAAAFVQASQTMAAAIDALCAASPEAPPAAMDLARNQWLANLAAWERLAGIAIGPVLDRTRPRFRRPRHRQRPVHHGNRPGKRHGADRRARCREPGEAGRVAHRRV